MMSGSSSLHPEVFLFPSHFENCLQAALSGEQPRVGYFFPKTASWCLEISSFQQPRNLSIKTCLPPYLNRTFESMVILDRQCNLGYGMETVVFQTFLDYDILVGVASRWLVYVGLGERFLAKLVHRIAAQRFLRPTLWCKGKKNR